MSKILHAIMVKAVITLCSILLYTPAKADHAAGGEIIYEWLHDSTYRFYFKFYKDCAGVTSEPAIATLCYFNSCNTQNGSISLPKIASLPGGAANGSPVGTGCAGSITRCDPGSNSSSLPGYREYWYSADFTLPSRCDYWTFFINISARNASNNLVGSNLLYIEATLNNLHASNSSSPYFSVKPVPYVCVNTPYVFNNGAVDPDNDSLSFEFIQPRTGPRNVLGQPLCSQVYGAANISFLAGYNLTNNPFPTNNTFTFDATTGGMGFTPAVQGTSTITVRVNEWRNGVKIGSVMRDIQIRTLPCNIASSSINTLQSSIVGGQFVSGRIEGAANQLLNFCFNAVTPNSQGILILSDNHSLVTPGASLTYTGQGGDSVTGCFSWLPSCADTGLKILAVTVKDSTCEPGVGITVSQTYTIPIYIHAGRTVEKQAIICSGDMIQLATSDGNPAEWTVMPGGSPISSLSCTSCSDPEARPETTTIYEARTTIGGCHNIDRITIRVDNDSNLVQITPRSPHVFCKPEMLALDVHTTGALPLTNLDCGIAGNRPLTPPDSVDIIPINAAIQNNFNPVSTPFNGAQAVTARYQYLLRAEDIRAAGMFSGTLNSLSLRISSVGTGAVYENFRIGMMCTSLDALDPQAGFVTDLIPVHTAPAPVSISGPGYITFNFDVPYDWDGASNLIVEFCYTNNSTTVPAYTYYYQRSYPVGLYSHASSGSLCGGGGNVNGLNELPQIRLGYNLAPETDFVYRWNGGIFFLSALNKDPAIYVYEDTRVWVHTHSRFGCLIGDTLDVHVPEQFEITPEEAELCYGEKIALRVLHADGVQWYEDGFFTATTLDCDTCSLAWATPEKAGPVTYTAVVSNNVGCTDTLYANIEVKPTPDIRILTPDTIVRYGSEVVLRTTGDADRYVWSPGRGLNNTAASSPVAQPGEPVTYSVMGAIDGCYGYDSVRIDIDYRDHIHVPDAFSPNGDGRNDVFRIVNRSFQKIQEFRVFNRYGQEVYYHDHTTADKGWDGTWNGVPQNVGTYHYLIRVAYPDGHLETLKGTVTLVR